MVRRTAHTYSTYVQHIRTAHTYSTYVQQRRTAQMYSTDVPIRLKMYRMTMMTMCVCKQIRVSTGESMVSVAAVSSLDPYCLRSSACLGRMPVQERTTKLISSIKYLWSRNQNLKPIMKSRLRIGTQHNQQMEAARGGTDVIPPKLDLMLFT